MWHTLITPSHWGYYCNSYSGSMNRALFGITRAPCGITRETKIMFLRVFLVLFIELLTDIGTSLFYQLAGAMNETCIRFQPTIQFFSSCVEILGKVLSVCLSVHFCLACLSVCPLLFVYQSIFLSVCLLLHFASVFLFSFSSLSYQFCYCFLQRSLLVRISTITGTLITEDLIGQSKSAYKYDFLRWKRIHIPCYPWKKFLMQKRCRISPKKNLKMIWERKKLSKE